MIKIELKDTDKLEKEYFSNIKDVIIKRLESLQKSLLHLTGNAIDVNDNNFDNYKHITFKIIRIVEPKKKNIPKDKFNKGVYTATVASYLTSPNSLCSINLIGLKNVLNILLGPGDSLEKLLTCPAVDLFNENEKFLNTTAINTSQNISVLKLAFDYENYSEISSKIRSFFNLHNFMMYCSYCNLEPVEFVPLSNGKAAKRHELDHFFDKARCPLLAFSMYNLIPSDHGCNSVNKGTKKFSGEYHLNPYIDGFGKSLKFEPLVLSVSTIVEDIKLKICEPFGSVKYKQLIGDLTDIDETNEKGNINAFALKTKYARKHEEAGRVLEETKKTDNGLRLIEKFLSKMELVNSKQNYIVWYYKHITTHFSQSRFNEKPFSKFNRDIHDSYYSKNKKITNSYIRELIAENDQ